MQPSRSLDEGSALTEAPRASGHASLHIRDFDAARDATALRACFIELQEFERAIDPEMPGGAEIADAYLDLMFRRCREFDGRVLVAVWEGAVVGFVTIWTRFRSPEPDDSPREHGYLSDLVVAASHRGRGIGRSLLRAAEVRVRDAGGKSIRLLVKARNAGALSLYSAEGFVEAEIYLEKSLV